MKRFVLVAIAACSLGACGHYDYGTIHSVSYYGPATLDPKIGYDGCPRGYYSPELSCKSISSERYRQRQYFDSRSYYSTDSRAYPNRPSYDRSYRQEYRSSGYQVTPPRYPSEAYGNGNSRRASVRSDINRSSGYQVTPPQYPGGRVYGQDNRSNTTNRQNDYRTRERRITRNDGSEQRVIERREYRNEDRSSRDRPSRDRRERSRPERNR